MSVNFRYRLEAEGRDTTWFWHRDAAILEADRWRNQSKVVDEDSDTIMIEWKDGECINTGFRGEDD